MSIWKSPKYLKFQIIVFFLHQYMTWYFITCIQTELFHFIFNTFFVTESESNDVTPNQEIINKRSECKHAKLRRPCKRNCPQFGQREFNPVETTPSSLTERCLVSVLNVSSPSADRTFNSQPDKSRIAQQRTLTLRWYNLELKNWEQWTSDLKVWQRAASSNQYC